MTNLLSNLWSQIKTSALIQINLILFVVALVYLPILNHEFVGDDFDFIYNWPALEQGQIGELILGDVPGPHQGTYRPGRSLLYLVVYQIAGTQSSYYHAFGLIVHLLITGLTYGLLRRLHSHRLALITSLLFGLHPIHVEAVTFITASFDTASFVFLLSSFWVFLEAHAGKKSLYKYSYLLGLVAISINETSLVLPGLIGLYLWLYTKLTWKQIINQLQPYLWLAGSWLGLRYLIAEVGLRNGFWGESLFYSWLVSLKSLVYYLYIFTFPMELGLIHTLPGGISSYMFKDVIAPVVRSQSILEPIVILGLVGLVVFVWKLWRGRQSFSLEFFGLGWMLLALLPVINLIPSAVIFSERYGYLASLGFCILVSSLLIRLTQPGQQRIILALGLTISLASFYAYQTWKQNQTWSDEISYWQYNTSQAPDNFLAWYQLGQVWHKRYWLDEAQQAYMTSIQLEPSYANNYHNLGLIYHFLGDYELAATNFTKAYQLNLEPATLQSLETTYTAWANQLERLGDVDKAQDLRNLSQPALTP